jgi:hypothetical protein
MQERVTGSGSSPLDAPKPKKLRRISRACDFCNKRSMRCKPSQEEAHGCQNCVDFDIACTFLRPAKKRGVKGHRRAPRVEKLRSSSHGHADLLLELANSRSNPWRSNSPDRNGRNRSSLPIAIDAPAEHMDMLLENLDKVQDLVSVYFEVVYPM